MARRDNSPTAIYVRKQDAFALFMRRTHALARIAHPATDGNENLVRNWGNAAANGVWDRAWPRWSAYAETNRRRYDEAMHREHADRAGAYLWCRHCTGHRAALECVGEG